MSKQHQEKQSSKSGGKWIRQRTADARKAVQAEASGKAIVRYSDELEKQIQIFKARMAVKKEFHAKDED